MIDFTSIAIGLGIAFILFKSFCLLWAGEGAEVYQWGKHCYTYHPRGFRESLDDFQKAELDKTPNCKVAWYDIVFYLWPFYSIEKFRTSENPLEIHASDVFTRGTKKLPRIELHTAAVMMVRVFTIRYIIQAFGRPRANLVDSCHISDRDNHVTFQGTGLSKYLYPFIQDNGRDSLRRAASAFVWDSNHERSGNDLEIVFNRRGFELATLYELAAPESSFGQAELLKQPGEFRNATEEEFLGLLLEGEKDSGSSIRRFFGKGVLSVDINIPGLDIAPESPDASEGQKAVNVQWIAKQKAAGERATGFAEAEVIAQKGKANASAAAAIKRRLPNVDDNTIMAGQILQDNENVTLQPVGLGTSLTDLFKKVIGGK